MAVAPPSFEAKQMSIISRRKFCLTAIAAVAFPATAPVNFARGRAPEELPQFSQVRALVESHMQTNSDFRRGDLITRGDVAPALGDVEALGWKNVSQSAAVMNLIEEGDFLARQLRSAQGQTFMRRVSGSRLIYDRLDRISRMPGGQRMIQDLIKLPDGHRYAKVDPGRGVPNLSDLLPKNASGKTARVPDLDKPTGKIYTLDEFLKQLEISHRKAQQP
jgi:hypothetical protein